MYQVVLYSGLLLLALLTPGKRSPVTKLGSGPTSFSYLAQCGTCLCWAAEGACVMVNDIAADQTNRAEQSRAEQGRTARQDRDAAAAAGRNGMNTNIAVR